MTTTPQRTPNSAAHPLRPHHPVMRQVRIPAHQLRIGDVIVDEHGQPSSTVTSVRFEGVPPVVSAGFAYTTRRRPIPIGDSITVLRLPDPHHTTISTSTTGSAA